jgi:hypothetical protein
MGSVERGASHHDFTRRRTISFENRTGRKGGGRRQGRACHAGRSAPRPHMREGSTRRSTKPVSNLSSSTPNNLSKWTIADLDATGRLYRIPAIDP